MDPIFDPTKDKELNTAYQRIQSGTPGAAIAGTDQKGDVANVDYAISKGWKPTVVKPTIPGIADQTNISDGTDSIRNEANKTNSNINDVTGQTGIIQSLIDKLTGKPTTDSELSLAMQTVRDNYANLKSNLDQAAIDRAGEAAGREYDPLISEAERAKKSGMGKAVVNAGERGGFMSTQFAGVGALLPTEGGTFVGTGGELNRIKSEYDANINKLQLARQQAIDAAKAAATKAQLTGKQTDFDNAKEMLNIARQSQNDIIDIATKIQNLDINAKKETRDAVTSAYNVIKDQQSIIENIPTGQSWTTKNPLTGEDMTFEGSKLTKPFFGPEQLTSIMLKLEKGESVTFKDPNTGEDITLTGIISQTPKTQTLVDDKGYAHTIDTLTGKEIAKSAVPVGKTKTQAANVTLFMNDQEKSDLSTSMAALEASKGEKYNSSEVAKQYRIYNQLHPGKGDQLLEAIKGEVNYDDQNIKELFDKKQENTDQMEITLPSGAKIKL